MKKKEWPYRQRNEETTDNICRYPLSITQMVTMTMLFVRQSSTTVLQMLLPRETAGNLIVISRHHTHTSHPFPQQLTPIRPHQTPSPPHHIPYSKHSSFRQPWVTVGIPHFATHSLLLPCKCPVTCQTWNNVWRCSHQSHRRREHHGSCWHLGLFMHVLQILSLVLSITISLKGWINVCLSWYCAVLSSIVFGVLFFAVCVLNISVAHQFAG